MPRQLFVALAAAVLVTAPGCDDKAPRGAVRGRVTLGTASLAPAVIMFENKAAGVAATCPLNDDGTYEVNAYDGRGLPAGTYQVAVFPGGVITDPNDATPLAGREPPRSKKQVPPKIPVRFHATATSKLEVTVKEGDNPPFDFDLTVVGK